MNKINCPLAPEIIDYGIGEKSFVVTAEKEGDRLSVIVGANENLLSLDYMYEYGQALARVHNTEGDFPPVRDRRFFHVPDRDHFEKLQMQFVLIQLNWIFLETSD